MNTEKNRFDTAYLLFSQTLDPLRTRLNYSDALTRPLLEHEIDRLIAANPDVCNVLNENLEKFWKMCEHHKVPRIFIGAYELVGADSVRSDGWPAIWAIALNLCPARNNDSYKIRFNGGCGNHDQHQTENTHCYLPAHVIGKAWDVKTRTEIDLEPFRKRMVVTKK